jgi:hypothetical protein
MPLTPNEPETKAPLPAGRVTPKSVGGIGALGSPRNTAIFMVPVLLVLITFLFWYQTWFGRSLSDHEMTEYLTDTSVPHKTQHALAQLSDRIATGDPAVTRWYPQLLAMSQNKESQLRLEAAWAMGQDNHSQEFHRALRKLLDDSAPMVRWNAALALARFGDGAGEPQLRAMLEPFTLAATDSGTIRFRMKERDDIRNGSIIARIRPTPANQQKDVLSPVGGIIARLLVKDGSSVTPGQALAMINPDETQVVESLRALYIVGQQQDLNDIKSFVRPQPDMSVRVREQAEATVRAIQERTKS